LNNLLIKLQRRATVTVALLCSINFASSTQRGEFESRYLWVVRNTLTSKSNIDEMLQFATINRFNHILVQVRGRGDAYYNSELVPKSNLIKDNNFDPLSYIIKEAKEKGINVHAWVNTYILWSSRVKPLQKDHILYTNSNWIDQNKSKQIDISSEIKKFNGGKNGLEGFYIAPNHPEVNSYLLSIFKDLVKNYDLDGLHLDYVRFHDSEYGQNPSAIAYYKNYFGINPSLSSNSVRKA